MLIDHLAANHRRGRRSATSAGLAIVATVICFSLAACTAVSAQDAPPGSGSTSGPTRGGSGRGASGSGDPGAADGVLPDHTSASDANLPGIAKLDPALRKAVQQAEAAMKDDGITMQVTTGWRSRKYQEELLEKAIRKYGSKKKALKWVADPDESHHVTGHAVDIGPTDADDWLIRKGNRFGLCQTLSNEMWHFELVTEPGGTCPPMS
ncbi:M15 family metallopeptidase [Kribbella sp. NPDC004875]|uniref:M15 family metallopeptidase n=1 Tax=Kribbella sp. NPDC004875 TaxID=3364107 RepID=UPI0036B50636